MLKNVKRPAKTWEAGQERQPKFSLLINPKSTMKHWTQTNEVEGVAENQHHHEPYPPPGPRNIVRCTHHHSNP